MDVVIAKIAQLINSSLDLEEVLRLVLDSVTNVMDSEAGSVILVDKKSDEFVIKVATGPKGKEAEGMRFPKDEGIAGWVFKTGKPRIISDVEQDKHFFEGMDKTTGFKTKSILAVPLRVKGEVIGVLEVLNRKDGKIFSEEDLSLFETLTDMAAISINNAQIYSELKETEEALRNSEVLYRTLFQNAPLGLGIVDLEGNLVAYNDAMLQPGGYTREDIAKIENVANLYYELEEREKALAIFRSQGFLDRHEVQFKRKDGTPYYAFLTLRPAKLKGLDCVQAVVEDITERKWAEQSILESEERLNGLIEHLPVGVCLLDEEWRLILANPVAHEYLPILTDTQEGSIITRLGMHPVKSLAEETAQGSTTKVIIEGPQIRIFEIGLTPIKKGRGKWVLVMREVTEEHELQMRAQTQSRLAAMGQLSAGVAHDLNNMLTVMMGFAEVLEMGSDVPENAKKKLNTIVSQGHRAEQLIRQILDFSRQRSARQQPLDLIPFLKEVVKLLTQTIPETIEIVTEYEDGDYVVNANLTQLQEAVTNLVVNARDAIEESGKIRIGLSGVNLKPGERFLIRPSNSSLVPQIEPGEWVVLTVADTGEGIPPDVITKIFEPFFTTKEGSGGTGLGLSQVYGIVKQHEGYIDVESKEGKGTTFKIYLKRIAEKAGPLEEAERGIPQGLGETILLVEDQEAVLEVIRVMLEGLNYRVITASGGQKALEIFDTHADEIALVLADVVMPEMGGAELAVALRERSPDIPIVMMSGHELTEGVSMPGEIDGLMRKPLTMLQVAQVVKKALGKEPSC